MDMPILFSGWTISYFGFLWLLLLVIVVTINNTLMSMLGA